MTFSIDLLSPKLVMQAYYNGLFPMSDSIEDPNIYWVEPEERGIIKLRDFKFSKSLKKSLKKNLYEIKANENFKKVITLCAKNKNRNESWINSEIIENYVKLHKIGKAKSVECYHKKKLIGGLYGVILGQIFCGESMFSLKENASKISMVYLAAYLKEGGFKIIDTQFFSNHLKQFGTIKVLKNEYLNILKKNSLKKARFPDKLEMNIIDYFR
jgi:leucyl/phenylalanyl-tRNA--protein transferase